MRMSVSPRNFGDDAIGGANHATDLEPSEDNVKVGRAADEAERAANLLGLSKASEENKQIAAAYILFLQMALRGRGLAEDRTPSRGARNSIAAQIRIEMRTVASP